MLKVLSDAYVAAGTGLVTLLSLLDLSAMFDNVDHQIIVERLQRTYCLRLRSWLEARGYAYVKYNTLGYVRIFRKTEYAYDT